MRQTIDSRPVQRLDPCENHDAHCEVREAVSTRLPADVEEQRRHRGQEGVEDARQRTEPNVQPGSHQNDCGHERHRREEAKDDLGLSEDRRGRPAQDRHELMTQSRAAHDAPKPEPHEPVDHQNLVGPEALAEMEEA
jgi:hypothetical protein